MVSVIPVFSLFLRNSYAFICLGCLGCWLDWAGGAAWRTQIRPNWPGWLSMKLNGQGWPHCEFQVRCERPHFACLSLFWPWHRFYEIYSNIFHMIRFVLKGCNHIVSKFQRGGPSAVQLGSLKALSLFPSHPEGLYYSG